MNIVDKILVDPITRGLKFFTKGGVPAYVSQVRARTDGSSPAAGYVGEVVTFFEQLALTSSGTSTGADHSLAAGTWLIFATTEFSNFGTITTPGTYLFIDGANSSTLGKDFYSDQVTHTGALNFPGPGFVSTYSKSSSFNISARITCGVNTGASFMFVSFTAVRIA
jgi:hypothetical protein